MTCASQLWEEVAIVVFGISLAIYYERSITEYPLALRILRLVMFPRRWAGKAFQYTWKETILVLASNNILFSFSVYLFVQFALPGFRLAIDAVGDGKVFGYLAVPADLACMLVLPSLALHCSRSLTQLLRGSDFLSYMGSVGKESRKLGLSPAVATAIQLDISQKRHTRLLYRFVASFVGLVVSGSFPCVVAAFDIPLC